VVSAAAECNAATRGAKRLMCGIFWLATSFAVVPSTFSDARFVLDDTGIGVGEVEHDGIETCMLPPGTR